MKKLTLSLVLTFFTLVGIYAQERTNLFVVIESNLNKKEINTPIKYDIIINDELYATVDANTYVNVSVPIGAINVKIVSNLSDICIKVRKSDQFGLPSIVGPTFKYEYIGSHKKEIYSTQFKARNDEKCYLLIKQNRDIIIAQNDGGAHDTLFLKGKIAKNAKKEIKRINKKYKKGKYIVKEIQVK